VTGARGRVIAVGLGPAGADLLVPAARHAISSAPVRFVRTARHPAVDDLAREGIAFTALDEYYERAGDIEAVYAAIAAELLAAAAEHGTIVYAVPGSPNVGERTTALLRAAGVELEIVPGLSFVDLAWARLGLDPLDGGRVVGAHAFAVDAAGMAGPLILAQCDSRSVLSEVKLALLEVLAPDHRVVVLQRLGRPDESVFEVELSELDRGFTPDHLTSVFVDTGETAVAAEFARLVALAERLRGPGGCPWDAAQTHHTLRRHALEEAYEVAEAIEMLPPDAPGGDVPLDAYDSLEDELGDLLFQVVIHAVLAAEAGAFTAADVARRVHDKLVHRHPHVFGDVRVGSADEVVTNWEQIKKAEKGHTSLVEGITTGLPALLYAQKLYRKSASVGLEPGAGALPRLRAAIDGLATADDGHAEAALGEVLAAAAAVGRERGIDAESALAGWARRFKDRFVAMESLARARAVDLAAAPPEVVHALWADAGAPA
jgi:tetrapyrrole methylase family protein/MazG family protein